MLCAPPLITGARRRSDARHAQHAQQYGHEARWVSFRPRLQHLTIPEMVSSLLSTYLWKPKRNGGGDMPPCRVSKTPAAYALNIVPKLLHVCLSWYLPWQSFQGLLKKAWLMAVFKLAATSVLLHLVFHHDFLWWHIPDHAFIDTELTDASKTWWCEYCVQLINACHLSVHPWSILMMAVQLEQVGGPKQEEVWRPQQQLAVVGDSSSLLLAGSCCLQLNTSNSTHLSTALDCCNTVGASAIHHASIMPTHCGELSLLSRPFTFSHRAFHLTASFISGNKKTTQWYTRIWRPALPQLVSFLRWFPFYVYKGSTYHNAPSFRWHLPSRV